MRLKSIAVLLSLVSLAILFGCGPSEGEEAKQARIDFPEGQFVSAGTCGTCHRDIYLFWQKSIHGQAAVNEVFAESLQDAVQSYGADTKRLCLTCHAPTTVVTGDLELAQSVTREGINCDFCHSMNGTDLSNPGNPFLLKVGSVKFGPVPDAESTGHDVEFSKVFSDSLICAGCHEYRNPDGLPILSTYSEWEEYVRGGGDKTCQNCHMPLVLANVVDPRVKRVSHSFVNLHSTPGGHSKDQLSKSLRVRIMEMERSSGGFLVKVQLSNLNTGHRVPTGSPSRKVVLAVTVSAEGGATEKLERSYERVVLDREGQPILKDSRFFNDSASIQSDTRLGPGEVKNEEFLFKIPEGENVEVTASLTYLHSPHNRPETEKRVEFFTEQRRLLSKWKR